MHLLEIELDLNESYGEYGNSGLNIEMNLSEWSHKHQPYLYTLIYYRSGLLINRRCYLESLLCWGHLSLFIMLMWYSRSSFVIQSMLFLSL